MLDCIVTACTALGARSRRPAVVFVLALVVSAACAAAQPSRFAQLTSLLDGAPPPLAADFARAALREMAAAYAREAELADRDQRALAHNPELPQWARGVAAYAAHLNALADRLAPRAAVGIELDPAGQAVLSLDSGPVVVAGPRIGEPGVLDEAILARFCAVHPCDALLALHRPIQARPAPPPRPVPPVSVSWSFAAGSGPLCRGDNGLELQFADTVELVRKRRLCTRVVRELNALARLLQQWDGPPDAAGLRVEAVDGEAAARVLVDGRDAGPRLALPTLAAAPDLLAVARPWLVERGRGRAAHWRLPDADRYLQLVAP